MDEEETEELPLLRGADLNRAVGADDLERPEDPELGHEAVVTPFAGGRKAALVAR